MRWPCMAACPRVMSRGHHSDCEAQHPTHGRSLSAWTGRKRPPLSFTLSGGRSHRKRSMGWRTTTRPLSRLRVPWAQATRPPHCLLATPACGFAPTHGTFRGWSSCRLQVGGTRPSRHVAPITSPECQMWAHASAAACHWAPPPRPHRAKAGCRLTALRPRRATMQRRLGHIARDRVWGPDTGRGMPAGTPPWPYLSRPDVGLQH